MEAETFFHLPTEEIAQMVRAAGPQVCGFPINGTRRWFMMEYEPRANDPEERYVTAMCQSHVALYRMLFNHGIDTILAPVFGPDLLERGGEYTEMAVHGLARLAEHPAFLSFYDRYQVRVGFYGDYRKFLLPTPYAYLCDLFDGITEQTRTHSQHRLLYGVCAHDPVQTVSELSVQHYQASGHAPDKSILIQLYYGMDVSPLSLFIGFDKFCVFDMPLITTGNEDLYFTVSPSLYLTERQLREILYDHLFTRRVEETDYSDLTRDDAELMRRFYHANRGRTLGIGAQQPHGRYWYPLPQVQLPAEFLEPVMQD